MAWVGRSPHPWPDFQAYRISVVRRASDSATSINTTAAVSGLRASFRSYDPGLVGKPFRRPRLRAMPRTHAVLNHARITRSGKSFLHLPLRAMSQLGMLARLLDAISICIQMIYMQSSVRCPVWTAVCNSNKGANGGAQCSSLSCLVTRRLNHHKSQGGH